MGQLHKTAKPGADSVPPLTEVKRNALGGAVPESPRSSREAVFFRLQLIIEDAIPELDSLVLMRIIGSQKSRGQVVTLNHQKQGGCNYRNESYYWNVTQGGLTCSYL